MGRRLVVLVAVVALNGCAWTQYRGNATRTAASIAPGVSSGTISGAHTAWTSADHGALAAEPVERNGRVVIPGATALWALDLADGGDAWHVDRTFGHQENDLAPASTWAEGGRAIASMSASWSDSISGTGYFQNLASLTTIDLAHGTVVATDQPGSSFPPLVTDRWVYEPQDVIVAVPPPVGTSTVNINVVARATDGSGATFTVPLSSNVQVVSGLAVEGDTLYVGTRSALVAVPANGCGAPTCAPVWSSPVGNGSTVGSVAVGRHSVFFLDSAGTLWAVPKTCAAPTCPPAWKATFPFRAAGLAIAGDRVYVTDNASLHALAEAGCGASTCAPVWTSTVTGTLSSPSVVNDLVLAGSSNGDLLAWNAASCGAPSCPATWSQAQGGPVGPVTPLPHALLFSVGGAVRKLAVP